jgi:hypothetical protein
MHRNHPQRSPTAANETAQGGNHSRSAHNSSRL